MNVIPLPFSNYSLSYRVVLKTTQLIEKVLEDRKLCAVISRTRAFFFLFFSFLSFGLFCLLFRLCVSHLVIISIHVVPELNYKMDSDVSD